MTNIDALKFTCKKGFEIENGVLRKKKINLIAKKERKTNFQILISKLYPAH